MMLCTSLFDDDNDENHPNINDNNVLLTQKSLIYKHHLFSVLTYVLEQCEHATLNPSFLTIEDDCKKSSFEHNLKVFLSKNNNVLKMNRDNNDLSSIIDEFYIDAIQVLHIHLLELEKVNDLCRDFCQRYIACLKIKFNVNNIFTDDDDDESEDFELNSNEDFESIEENEEDFILNQHQSTNKHILKEQHYDKQLTPANDLNSICNQYTLQFNGQTSLSQIITNGSSFLCDKIYTERQKQPTNILSSSSKRSVLPKSAISIMRSWLFQHIVHPYPTDDEKRIISRKTNLSLLQVNNWFINARRRILQPMFETSNSDLITLKKKKRHNITLNENHQHTYNRTMTNINRYWPSHLIQLDKHLK